LGWGGGGGGGGGLVCCVSLHLTRLLCTGCGVSGL